MNREELIKRRKKMSWAVMEFGEIIKSGFTSAEAAYDWLLIHCTGQSWIVAKVWE